MKTQILTKLQRQLIPNIGTLIAVAFTLFIYTAWAAQMCRGMLLPGGK